MISLFILSLFIGIFSYWNSAILKTQDKDIMAHRLVHPLPTIISNWINFVIIYGGMVYMFSERDTAAALIYILGIALGHFTGKGIKDPMRQFSRPVGTYAAIPNILLALLIVY